MAADESAVEATGPLPRRWWPVVVSLVALLVLGFVAWDGERNLLRAVECMRPGRCIVTRGSDWVGRHVALDVDADRFNRVELRDAGGKNTSPVLWLVAIAGDEYELMRGPEAPQLAERLLPFFELRSEATLSLRPKDDLGERGVPLGMAFVALLSLGYFVRDSLRRASRDRTTRTG